MPTFWQALTTRGSWCSVLMAKFGKKTKSMMFDAPRHGCALANSLWARHSASGEIRWRPVIAQVNNRAKAWPAMHGQQCSSTTGVAYNEQRGGETSSVTLIPSRPTIPFRSSSDKDSRFLVDGYAKFGDVKLGAGWIYRRLRADAVSLQTNLFFAGATYTVTPSVVLDGQYVGLRSTVDGVSGDLAIARVTYLLSKRSAVYVAGAHMFNGHASTFSVSSTSPVPAAPVAGRGQTGVMIGVRELF